MSANPGAASRSRVSFERHGGAASPSRAASLPPAADRGRPDAAQVTGPNSAASATAADATEALPPCPAAATTETLPPHDPPQRFSVAGYRARTLPVHRQLGQSKQLHCLQVAWPAGRRSSAGQPCTVAANIDDAWLQAIQNTLARVPWSHVQLLRRIVIDNRPKEHGIAPFGRGRADDARDGHTIWLHQHLFMDPNHFARGNYGRYWSYHVNVDGVTIDGAPVEHDWFSPVLLHELGHLVNYHLVNAGAQGADVASVPDCAKTCRDDGTCARRSPAQREQGCVSPYCGPFRFPGSSENWAEQYRFYYQSSVTRGIVQRGFGCAALLAELDEDRGPTPAPWQQGLPDIATFRKSRWSSCGERACKEY